MLQQFVERFVRACPPLSVKQVIVRVRICRIFGLEIVGNAIDEPDKRF